MHLNKISKIHFSRYDELTSKFKRYLRSNELKIGFLTKTHKVEEKKVEKILHHPKFDPDKMTNDVALLKLSQKITCDTYKHPICLPPADFKSDNQKNTTFYVTGWGATSLNFKSK